MGRPLEYFEVRVAGKVRGVHFSRGEADRFAMDVAWAELVEVEVRTIRSTNDREKA